MTDGDTPRRRGPLALVGPGLLVAATGVGAGDLITPTLAGAALGLSIAWVPLAGALLKWTLNEGLARWQLATNTTLLEGWNAHFGPALRWTFGVYLVLWAFVTGGALVNACGLAASSLAPLDAYWPALFDATGSRATWGVVHALAGLALVRLGNFARFETLMSIAVAVMFALVLGTAIAVTPDLGSLARAVLRPALPDADSGLVLGVLGGVGGTVTVLSYGYWIAEHGRSGAAGVRACRIDLAVCYLLTGLFGVAMIAVGSRVQLGEQGSRVALELGDQLAQAVGPWGRVVFLVGFWCAVFSSLLGVWQGVPYLFADFAALGRRRRDRSTSPTAAALTTSPAYRRFQWGLTLLPLLLLGGSVRTVQLGYAVCGALFMPLLAVTLLVLNNRERLVGRDFRNGWFTNLLLVATLLLFAVIGGRTLLGLITP